MGMDVGRPIYFVGQLLMTHEARLSRCEVGQLELCPSGVAVQQHGHQIAGSPSLCKAKVMLSVSATKL